MHAPARPIPFVLLGIGVVLLMAIPCAGQESSLRLLNDKTEALQARIDLIQQAEHTIDVAYYAIDTDEVPVTILELLRRASLRGVRVRMLVDGLKSRLPSKFEHYLRRFGIQVRVYHPTHRGNPAWLNRRLHSKLMVIDAQQAIIGSRNLENEYYEFAPGRNFADCDALVAGDVAGRAQAYFDWLWSSPDVQPAPDRDSLGLDVLRYRPFGRTAWNEAWRDATGPADYQRLLNLAVQKVICRSNVKLNSNKDWMSDAIEGLQISLLHDCHSDKSEDNVQRGIMRLIDQARCCILIESPYPAFDREIRSAITRARCRGVRVTILTNSLKTTDQLSVYAAYQNHKRSLLKEGVRLREFCGKDTLHAKTMIVDNARWLLGSYNFDARSDNLNLELCIVSHDPAGAAALRRNVQKRMSKSTAIAKQGIVLPVGQQPPIFKRACLSLHRTFVEFYRGYL